MGRLPWVVATLGVLIGCAEGPPDDKSPVFEPRDPGAPARVEAVARAHLETTDVLHDVDELASRRIQLDRRGVAHVRLDQRHFGIPVLGGQAIVHVPSDGKPIGVTDRLMHELDVDPVASLDDAEAIRIASEHVGRLGAEVVSAELTIVRQDAVDHLTWHVELRDLSSEAPALPVAFVDAHSGAVVLAFDNLQTGRDRDTFDAQNSFNVPAQPARTENQGPVSDPHVDDAHDFVGKAWDYYDLFLGRDSFDDNGATVVQVVELGPSYFNAFWDPQGQVFGYGDGGSGPGFGQALDVVAHEFTHAVTQYTADLVYTQQSGGLNEASSDIMSAVIESWDDNWAVNNNTTFRVGEDLGGGGFRSMINPPVSSFNNYNNGLGVHQASGIANRAFVDWVQDPALTIEEAGDIWYAALTTYMTPLTTYPEARLATQQAAIDLYGPGPKLDAVVDGWVLVDVPGTPAYAVFDDVGPIALSTNQQATYTFTPSPSALAVKFLLVGRNGDADLYVSNGSTPTTSNYDCRSATSGSFEDCEFNPASPGSYQVMVRAFSSFSDARLYAWEANPGGLCLDADGDGFTTCAGDCDDNAAAVNPGAAETCNGIDDDCDGNIDGPTAPGATSWFDDVDGDGFGDPSTELVDCTAPAGFIATGGDCDDGDGDVNPGATEVCNTVDDDCDGTIDGETAIDASTFYIDGDGDGYGDAGQPVIACTAPAGTVGVAGDCDDVRASVNPGIDEVCNFRDDDCDGTVDGESALDALTFYVDGDGDGYGDANQVIRSCQLPAGAVTLAGDCNDAVASVNPGAFEVCNGVDDDCDNAVDPSTAVGATLWYRDGDQDGFGDLSQTERACDQPTGYRANAGDCDDTLASVNPNAVEACNGIDDNCDSVVDPPSSANSVEWYLDGDGDGYGNPALSLLSCAAPTGYVANAEDCNDVRSDVSPGAPEVCDPLDVDEDCDGSADESGAQGEVAFWVDADADGFGDSATEVIACNAPVGTVVGGGPSDCDDGDDQIAPSMPEVCDGIDQDCDGAIDDDAIDFSVFYLDEDGDGFGLEPVEACEQPDGTALVDGDCDDTDDTVNPEAVEIPNDNIDQDCDGADLRDDSVDPDPTDPDPTDPDAPTDPEGPGTERNTPTSGVGCSTTGPSGFPAGALLIGLLALVGRRRQR